MPPIYSSLIAMLLMVFTAPAARAAPQGGVSLDQTRIIFSTADKVQTIKVNNTSKQKYLIQSRIQRDINHESSAPFIVTPPLFPLGPENNQLLRIFKQDEQLPVDRESLFYLAVLAIPAQSEPAPQATRLSMGFQFVIKLFYRPEGLKIMPQNAYCQLKFSPTPKGIQIENPTPYFLTFGSLSFDQKVIDLDLQPSMLAPMSTAVYSATKPVHQVQWQNITDTGGWSAPCQQTVSPS